MLGRKIDKRGQAQRSRGTDSTDRTRGATLVHVYMGGTYLNGKRVVSGTRLEVESETGKWFPIHIRLEGGPVPDVTGCPAQESPKFAGGGELVLKLPPTARFRWPRYPE
jgi:hypothetical protein